MRAVLPCPRDDRPDRQEDRVSPEAMALVVVILSGCVILSVVWELAFRRDVRDAEAAEKHAALMREIRRHSPS